MAEQSFDTDHLDANLNAMNRATAVFIQALTVEEDFWMQKAAKGERNTKYFHTLVKKKRARNKVHNITKAEEVLSNPEQIKRSAVQHLSRSLVIRSSLTWNTLSH